MRKNDFSQVTKKNALRRAGYKCERCWTKRDLEFHHKIPLTKGGDSSLENCIVLCHNCHNIAPKDPFLFEKIFLRFASMKELIQHYHADDEDHVIKLLSRELGLEYKELKNRIETDPMSHVDTIKHGMRKRVKSIGHSGFNIPYGYYYDSEMLKVISNEAEIIRKIYKWYLEGVSMGEIAKMLNSNEIPTKRGGLWAKKTISTILKNPVYCGYHRFEGEVKKGKHKIIIELNDFEKVQKTIDDKGGKTKNYNFR